jgi:NADH dehydrogenase [ubiquinone] 1 alpha subcomplex assembly factor 8
MPGRTRPIEKFAEAAAKCTAEVTASFSGGCDDSNCSKGAVYGKCISANYQNVSKDMCAKEFIALKDCYLVCPCDFQSINICLT